MGRMRISNGSRYKKVGSPTTQTRRNTEKVAALIFAELCVRAELQPHAQAKANRLQQPDQGEVCR